jgi:hypothetical protein
LTASKPKLDVDQFVVVPQSEKPPPPTREKIHSESGTYNFLKLQIVECKDLKGVEKNGTPTAFIVHKDPYEKGNQGTVLLQTETLKSNNPIYNEMFKVDVADPEKTQIIIRFSNGKKHTTHGKDKAYIGEIKIELRALVRQEFNSPNNVFKWFNITNGSEKSGEAKLFLEFTDLREKTNRGPTNVQHHGHIGIVNGVFSADNLPAEWKEQLKQAGVRKKDLNNPELRDLLFGLILKEGGTLAADDAPQQQSLPNTNGRPSTPQPNLPQPSLPQPNLPQPNLPQPNTQPRPNLPPNPQPNLPPINQQPAFLPQNNVADEPMKRGTSPPPMKDTAQPGNQPTGRAPRAPRAPQTVLTSNTASSNHEEIAAKPVENKPKPMMGGPPVNFLDEIAKGAKLKSAEERREPELPPPEQGGLAGALSAALNANRLALGGGLDNGGDEDSDWD